MKILEIRVPAKLWRIPFALGFVVLGGFLVFSVHQFLETRVLTRLYPSAVIVLLLVALTAFWHAWKRRRRIVLKHGVLTYCPPFGTARAVVLKGVESITLSSDDARRFSLTLSSARGVLKIPFTHFATEDLKGLVSHLRKKLDKPLMIEDCVAEYASLLHKSDIRLSSSEQVVNENFELRLTSFARWIFYLLGVLGVLLIGVSLYALFDDAAYSVVIVFLLIGLLFIFLCGYMHSSKAHVSTVGVEYRTVFGRKSVDFVEMGEIKMTYHQTQHGSWTNLKITSVDGTRKISYSLDGINYKDLRRLAFMILHHSPAVQITIDGRVPWKYRTLFDFMEYINEKS